MAAQRGDALLIRLGNGGTPETFAPLAGLRTKTMTFNNEQVDVTHSESAGKWRELLEGAGIRSASVSGSGVFLDAAIDAGVRTAMFAGQIRNMQILIPDFGTVEGPFQFASLQYAGEHNGEVTYDVTLESAGQLAFLAV